MFVSIYREYVSVLICRMPDGAHPASPSQYPKPYSQFGICRCVLLT